MKRKSDETRLLEAFGIKAAPRLKVIKVSFKTSYSEMELIAKIALRAVKQAREMGRKWSPLDVQMDVVAVHANGCPLNLQKFLDFPDFDFAHDIVGIRNNLDRRNGRLVNCFLPRCAVPSSLKGNANENAR